MLYVGPNRLLRLAFPGVVPTGEGADAPTVSATLAGIDGIGTPPFFITGERDTDLVLLDFAFYGFTLETGTPPTLVPGKENLVAVQFPPQAMAEGVYQWIDANPIPFPPPPPPILSPPILGVDPPPILSDVSGPSRLCFSVPPGHGIPLPTMTVSDLIDWRHWSLVVPPVAQVPIPPRSSPIEPDEFQTAIEFPYALFLAPTTYASGPHAFTTGFAGRRQPLVSPAGVVDLWSASLVGSQPGSPSYVPKITAVWAVDYVPNIVTSSVLDGPDSTGGVPSDTPETNINYTIRIG